MSGGCVVDAVRVSESGTGLEWTCCWTPCERTARWAVVFRGQEGQDGHVHYCPECLSEAMGRFDIETAVVMPCPYGHRTVYTQYPPELGGVAG